MTEENPLRRVAADLTPESLEEFRSLLALPWALKPLAPEFDPLLKRTLMDDIVELVEREKMRDLE